jgi:hypothetical protein
MVKQSIDPFTFPTDPSSVGAARRRGRKSRARTSRARRRRQDRRRLALAGRRGGERNAWNVVLGLLTNPPLLMILMTPNPAAPNEPSPLLRKTLALNGIKSDQEVREIWRVGQVVLQQMQMMTMATAAAKGGMPGLGMLMGGGMGSPPAPAKHPTGHPTPGAMAG